MVAVSSDAEEALWTTPPTETSLIIVGPLPAEFDTVLAKRRRLGQDGFDEMWDGVYHVVPTPSGEHAQINSQIVECLLPHARRAGLIPATACNIGVTTNYRVPDQAYFDRGTELGSFNSTARVVVEIFYSGDETYTKLPFYYAVGVSEVLLVDPRDEWVEWRRRRPGGEFMYEPASAYLEITAEQVREALGWPTA